MASSDSFDEATALVNEVAAQQEIGWSLIEQLNLALVALPVAARAAIRHVLGYSEPSKYLDLRSEVIVAIIRALAVPRQPPLATLPFIGTENSNSSGVRSISDTQRLLNRDPGVKGPVWISRYTAPGGATAAENAALRDALADVVVRLHNEEGEGRNGAAFPDIAWPDIVPVEAEWTGHRTGAREGATLPSYTDEVERYAALMSHVSAPQHTTVLYLHGGAMYLLDPASHRGITRALARRICGRCYSVRYRLAPKDAFPAQILDALVSYLTLLYPPPGAYHEAVPAQHIVFSGDSAGGNLCLALTRVLLEFQRHNTHIQWHGQRRPVPLPAGVALNSPWIDITMSSPSWQPSEESCRADFDYLPSMPVPGGEALNRPSCDVWPTKPERHFLYVDTALATHPLVSLLLSNPDGWRGAPPMYVCVGWEMLADEIGFFTATHLHNGGQGAASVVFEQYEAMPHCFALVLPYLPGAKRCTDSWARFIRQAVEQPETLRAGATGTGCGSSFTYIEANTLKESPVDPDNLAPYTDEMIRETICKRMGALGMNQPATTKTTAKL